MVEQKKSAKMVTLEMEYFNSELDEPISIRYSAAIELIPKGKSLFRCQFGLGFLVTIDED